jgi:hypothetical protein
LFFFSGDKEGSEGIVEDVLYRRLHPFGNFLARPLAEALPHTTSQQYYVNVRRGSVPADLSAELRLGNGLGRNGNSGRSRTRKKVLRRRSSGGPEMFTGSGSEPVGDGVMWQQRWRREMPARWTVEQAVARRRGSLPIDMLTTTHSGELVQTHSQVKFTEYCPIHATV